MRFDLSEDVEFFRATARRFIAEEMPVATTRALESDPDGFDRATWRRAAELGWTSLLAPESLGGGGLSANAGLRPRGRGRGDGTAGRGRTVAPRERGRRRARRAGTPSSSRRSCPD